MIDESEMADKAHPVVFGYGTWTPCLSGTCLISMSAEPPPALKVICHYGSIHTMLQASSHNIPF